jgi:hypothetical protein
MHTRKEVIALVIVTLTTGKKVASGTASVANCSTLQFMLLADVACSYRVNQRE